MTTTLASDRVKLFSPLLPYTAVAIGLYGFRSAFAAMAAYHIGAITLVLSKRRSCTATKRAGARLWMITAAIVCSMGGVIFYFLWPYLNTDPLEIGRKLADFGISRNIWPYLALYFCLVNATTEEFFWRGYLGTETPTPVFNDFLFGGYHALVLIAFTSVVWTIPVIVACAFAGWLWRMIKKKSGGLLVPVITHIFADVSIVMAVHLRLLTTHILR